MKLLLPKQKKSDPVRGYAREYEIIQTTTAFP